MVEAGGNVIAAVGNLSWDVVDGRPRRPGGAVFYSARALARLGVDARVAASCAAADKPLLIPVLEGFGLPVAWYESAATTAYRFRYTRSGRRLMHQEAVGDPWSPQDAVVAVGDARWVHVGALVQTDFPVDTLAALARDERRLLVDAQGLVRTADLGPLRTTGEIGDALRHVTILKLNDEEAETLVGSADPERLRSLDVPEVILTLGAEGAAVITPDLFQAVPAVDLEIAVDPTGAGDMFSAAYLAARSAAAEPAEAARSATETVAALLSSD